MSVDELIPRARELVAEGVTSKTGLQKALKVSWDKAVAVHQTLTTEAEQVVRDRAAKRRDAVRRMRTQKGSGRGLASRRAPLPVPVSPVIAAVQKALFAEPAEVISEGAKKAPPTPVAAPSAKSRKGARTWPVVLLALPAFVAIWSGWVDLGRLTGFGVVHPLPGIFDEFHLNTAITLPIGLETYAAYALYVWLSGTVPPVAARFARRSAIGSLVLGAGGQVAYHLMVAAGMTRAPWWITTIVACLPVAVLGMGAALRHLVHADQNGNEKES